MTCLASGAGRRALQEVPKAIEKLFSMIHQLKADFNRGNDERGIYPRKIIDLIAAFPDSGDRYPPAQLTSWIHSSPLSTLCQEDHQKLQSFVQHFATGITFLCHLSTPFHSYSFVPKRK